MKQISISLITLLAFAGFASAQQQMLILNRGTGQLLSVRLANPNSPKVVIGNVQGTKINRALDLVFDQKGKNLFWIDGEKRKIEKGNQEGENVSEFDADNSGLAVDMDIDQAHDQIYWVDQNQEKIFRSDLDGGGKQALPLEELYRPNGIAVSPAEDRLFWTEHTRPVIRYSRLNGKDPQAFTIQVTQYPFRLAIDELHQKLYWSSDIDHSIGRCNFDGSEQEVIYKGLEEEYPFGLFINQHDQKLYWTDYGTDKVMRSNLDGTEAQSLLENLDDPLALVIHDAPQNQNLESPPLSFSEETLPGELSIYPNPSRSDITLVIPEILGGSNLEKNEIRIFSQLGTLVWQKDQTGWIHQIQTGELPSGIYLCVVKTNERKLHKHFVLIK